MGDGPVLTRRDFLAVTGGALLATGAAARSQSPSAGTPRAWYDLMRRCGQLNLNERDPLTLEVAPWIDYWASLRVDALLLNGGGIVAFYPTGVPLHHRSEFLGSRDLFGELVSEAKRRTIRVVARMDCNYAYEDALRARPEWFERNRDGSPRPHGESPWLFKTCMFGPYFTDQMPAIYREIAGRYDVDGFFTNGWPSTGALEVCYCENCRKVYRDGVGGEPPDQTDATSPLYRKYYDVYMRRVSDVWSGWQTAVAAKRPDIVYVGNLGGGIQTVKNVADLGRVARWFNADHQGRSGDTPIWACAQQGRVAQSVMGGRPITNVTGAYSNSRVTWRHVAKPAAETTMWLAQTVATGMVPWFHWLGGAPEDQRWRETGRQFFTWLAEHERHFRNRRSIADVAVLYPQRTIAFYRSGGPGSWRGAERAQTTEYLQGFYLALLEGRFAFDFVHEDLLDGDALARYRVLLLPNAAYLSDRQCDQIRRYAASGGSIVATYETSKYTEWGDARPDFALADVLGASAAGPVMGVRNGYMRIEQRTPIVTGFDGTALLPGPENRVPIHARAGDAPVLTVVPGYPAFPPEMVFPRTPRTDEPAAIFRQQGTSRVAYFAGDVDRTRWRSGSEDLSRLLRNAIRWARGDEPAPVAVSGDGMAEIVAWETEDGYALHLLNYNNPNMTRAFMTETSPLGRQQVSLQVAPDRAIKEVRALRTDRRLPFTQRGRTVRFDVPSVADYEVAVLM